ncbi:UNVERIFIED_CONTAM: hypothetical protein K2H54_049818, partial [Gekko kuhli]
MIGFPKEPFPSEETTENDDDVYRSLEELADEHDLGEDIYDCVPCEDEGDDIYEDIIKVEVQQPMVGVKALGRSTPGPKVFDPLSCLPGPFHAWHRCVQEAQVEGRRGPCPLAPPVSVQPDISTEPSK